jgi:hypothetical protein
VTMSNASIGDKSWTDNAQLVALGTTGSQILSLSSVDQDLGFAVFPAGTPADNGIESAAITASGDALLNTSSLLLTTESGGDELILSAANNHDVTVPLDVDGDGTNNEIFESATVDAVVGVTASASDADIYFSAVSYSLTDDAGGRFQIDATTGVVSVRLLIRASWITRRRPRTR